MTKPTRRNFLKNVLLGGSSFAAGYATYHFLKEESLEKIILGEEWRNDKQVNAADLAGLPSDEETLVAARQAINTYRKADFELLIQLPDGDMLAGQSIRIEQTHHDVTWGCSGAGSHFLLQQDALHQKRSVHFAKLFDCTTAKCYWNERWHQPIEQKEGIRLYERFLDEVAWAKAMGIQVKGHPLVWTVPKAIPKWLLRYDDQKQVELLKAHVQSLVEIGGDDVALWDLCNEMLWEPAFKNVVNRQWPHLDPIEDIADYIAPALQWAREVNPKAVYSLNDYGLVYTYRKEISAGEQRRRYLALIEALRNRNVLPDAIGCQSHIGGKFQLAALRRALEDLAQSGLPVQVTEYWSKESDFKDIKTSQQLEEALATYVCDCYTVAYAIPAVSHFTYWDSRQFFDKQGEPTLLYHKLFDLIRNQWTTRETLQTDQYGKVAFNGFKGKYSLSLLAHPGKKISLDLGEGGKQTVRLAS